MALQRLPGVNHQWLFGHQSFVPPPALASILVDAAADRVTYIGRFAHQDQAAKTVDGVGFLFGTVSKGAGSTFQVSLQDVSLATGPIGREDGTPDQTLTIANADAGFASNLWYEAAFDAAATRSLAVGELVAVVFQFASFVSADTVNLRGVSTGGILSHQGYVSANLTGSYAIQGMLPNVVLRCTDGSYGTLSYAWPCSAVNTHAFANNTAGADEYALAVQFPMPCRADGLWCYMINGTGADTTEVLLYGGTTPMSTTVLDHNTLATAAAFHLQLQITEQLLAANTLYRLAIRPLANNNVSVYSFDVANANHLQCHPGGVNAHLWTRLDQGAWGGEVTTRRLFAGIRLSAFDDGASAGGGPLLGPGRLVRS